MSANRTGIELAKIVGMLASENGVVKSHSGGRVDATSVAGSGLVACEPCPGPHSGFSVHAEVSVADRVSAARLGRYMIRCPVVLKRLSLDQDTGEVLYRTRPSRADHPEGRAAASSLAPLLDPLADGEPALEHREEPFRRRARLTWAALIRRVYEAAGDHPECRSRRPRRSRL